MWLAVSQNHPFYVPKNRDMTFPAEGLLENPSCEYKLDDALPNTVSG
jgi:hypothetical protein